MNSDTCRLCLAISPFSISLFSDFAQEKEVLLKLQYCIPGLNITFNKRCPTNVCYKCVTSLDAACDFIKRCRVTETILSRNDLYYQKLSIKDMQKGRQFQEIRYLHDANTIRSSSVINCTDSDSEDDWYNNLTNSTKTSKERNDRRFNKTDNHIKQELVPFKTSVERIKDKSSSKILIKERVNDGFENSSGHMDTSSYFLRNGYSDPATNYWRHDQPDHVQKNTIKKNFNREDAAQLKTNQINAHYSNNDNSHTSHNWLLVEDEPIVSKNGSANVSAIKSNDSLNTSLYGTNTKNYQLSENRSAYLTDYNDINTEKVSQDIDSGVGTSQNSTDDFNKWSPSRDEDMIHSTTLLKKFRTYQNNL